MDLADKIKEARKTAKMTQKQLADAVGLSRESITNYERGRFKVPTDMLSKIADATGHPMSWFFRDGPPEPPREQGPQAYYSWAHRFLEGQGLPATHQLLTLVGNAAWQFDNRSPPVKPPGLYQVSSSLDNALQEISRSP